MLLHNNGNIIETTTRKHSTLVLVQKQPTSSSLSSLLNYNSAYHCNQKNNIFYLPPSSIHSHHMIIKRSNSSNSNTNNNNDNETAASSSTNKIKSKGLTQLLNENQRNLIKEIKKLLIKANEVTIKNNIMLKNNNNTTTTNNKYHHDPTIKPIPFLEDNNNNTTTNLKDSTFILVVAGEFNTGKSTFINAILGEELLKSGPLPTTDSLTIITHDNNYNSTNTCNSASKEEVVTNDVSSIHKHSKSKLLRDITIIDTPGTNTATYFHHTKSTIQLLPNADIIFFITSVERPLTASEIELLDYIKQYKKQLILIVNKIDLLENLDTNTDNYGKDIINNVVQYVKERVPNCKVIPISSKNALVAKLAVQKEQQKSLSSSSSSSLNDNTIILPKYGAAGPLYNRSNFESFEIYLQQTLCNNASIITTKLCSPLGIIDAILSNLKESIIQPTINTLQKDKQTLYLLDNQMIYFKNDLLSSWNNDALSTIVDGIMLKEEYLRMDYILNNDISWYDFITGGLLFFKNYDYFVNTIWKNYDDDTNNNINKVIPDILDEYCESTITKAKTQTHAIIEYLGKRPIQSYESIIVGSIPMLSSPTNIQKQLDMLQIHFHKQLYDDCHIKTIKEKHEHILCKDIYSKLRFGCISSTLCFSSGLCLSFYLQFFNDSSNIIVPLYYHGGIISATTMLSYALFVTTKHYTILSYQQYIKKQYVNDVYERNMIDISTRYIDKIMKLFNDSILPYVRYVNGEYERMETLEKDCNDLLMQSSMLRQRVLDSTKN